MLAELVILLRRRGWILLKVPFFGLFGISLVAADSFGRVRASFVLQREASDGFQASWHHLPRFKVGSETIWSMQRQLVKRLSVDCLRPLVNLPQIQISAIWVNQIYYVVVVDKIESVAIKFLHAARLELSQCNFLVPQLSVELLIAELEKFFELR